jgi:hypothetical protein
MPLVSGVLAICAGVIAFLKYKINKAEREKLKAENDANAKIWADSVKLDKELQKINEATKTAVKAAKTAAFPNGIDLE